MAPPNDDSNTEVHEIESDSNHLCGEPQRDIDDFEDHHSFPTIEVMGIPFSKQVIHF